MVRRNTWIVLLIAIGLLAITLFWQRTKQSREGDEEVEVIPTQSSKSLITLGDSGVTGITIQDSDGNTVILERDADSLWGLVFPEAETTDSERVESALTQLLTVKSVASLSSSTPLQDLGLDNPNYRIVLQLENGGQIVINVGKATAINNGYYVLVSDRDRAIYVAGKFNLDEIIGLLDTPPIAPTPSPTVEVTEDSAQTGTATPTP